MRGLAAAVLTFQAVVVLLAVPVAITVADVERGPALAVGFGLAAGCIVVAGSQRRRWGYAAGWAIQAATVALGFVVPAMFLLGGVFAGLWLVALRLGKYATGQPAEPPG